MKILIASNNQHKISEIAHILKLESIDFIELTTPEQLNINLEVEESEATLEGNAMLKAKAFFELTGIPAIADDTGLEVKGLDGKPGVHSARFAGEPANDAKNRELLLSLLKDKSPEERIAQFRTVICYFDNSGATFIEGKCTGLISEYEAGSNGFGYDSVFIPDGYDITFAQMSSDEKNKISHRYRAIINFARWVKANH